LAPPRRWSRSRRSPCRRSVMVAGRSFRRPASHAEPLPSARPPRSAPSARQSRDWVSRNDYPGQAVREG
jgi:hypothetical protein